MNSAGTARAEESSCNAGIWFDGYLNRQMIDGGIINSYSHGRTFTMYRYDISFNNSTKSNPGWYGDFLGDWREEVIVPDQTHIKNIKIISTWYPTDHRIPWLMTDHTYYMQAIHENVGYNQPTNVGYYLGSDYTSDAEIRAAAAKAEADRQAALEQTLTNIRQLSSATRHLSPITWYSITGQKVDTPKRGGIYIRNNRKVLIK